MLEGHQERLLRDIEYLASEELMGREPGTEGAQLAAQYISEQFAKLSLASITSSEYFQEFSISKEVLFPKEKNMLTIKRKTYTVGKDYFPLKHSSNFSANAKTVFVGYGIKAPEIEYNDYKKLKRKKLENKIFVMDVSSPDGVHPHSKYVAYHDLGSRVELAVKKGATAVIFVNLEGNANDPNPKFRKINQKGVPVIFVQNKELAEKLKKGKKVKLSTFLQEKKVTAFNVVGFLDNGATKTVVVGAHYDHLGMGGASSLYAGKEPRVHYGADDNASGVAGLLEIARNAVQYRKQMFSKYNYAFVAFSGEEMGLLGSSHFTKKLPHRLRDIAYMINMDMIGRMEDGELAINGTGTSPIWDRQIRGNNCSGLKFKLSESGVGPSDHTSFYYKEVPVLHFFTGTHKDYHKPTDIAEKINFKGEALILGYILHLIRNLEKEPEIIFTATSEENMQNAPRFTVTLGVMPDYMYEGEGMKIDGVTEGKPASRAGMQAGDVVIKMGKIKVVDMMSYMKALSAHKKGDTVNVVYMRGDEKHNVKVQF